MTDKTQGSSHANSPEKGKDKEIKKDSEKKQTKASQEAVEPDLKHDAESVMGNAVVSDTELTKDSEEKAHENNVVKNNQKQKSAENKIDKPVEQPDRVKSGQVKKKSGVFWLILIVLLLVIIVGLAALTYIAKQEFQRVDVQSQKLNDQNSLFEQQLGTLQSDAHRFAIEQSQAELELEKRLAAAEQRLQAQNKRITSLTTTSREDWLLAEAEYLLKLANQRILVERNASSAVALFQEADNILRDLDDPDLFALREAVKKDTVALKLSRSVDVEGIYLELSALISQIETLPLVPEKYDYHPKDEENETSEASSTLERFIESFKSYVRVINHEEKPVAILPPDATAYLHLNLRLMLERGQLALLREQPEIYRQTLSEAELWVGKYFPSSEMSDRYQEEIKKLSERSIIVALPDVSDSLELLRSYIHDLHTLNTSLGKPLIDAPLSKKESNNNELSKFNSNSSPSKKENQRQVEANEEAL